ncbi:hypothetical protein H5410_062595 [Solanum commersonii]|uniref:DUF4371 domain-containing protein n=1 Tax=Solanum commersonii TaxID=4109 RepID=A0A9J5WBB4_SOLCO|nr:hypothetical protein H5410_062595 [Solanum commersonii]
MHSCKLSSAHNHAKKKYDNLMRQEQSIQAAFASVKVVRLLLNQGLAFCGHGHREDESSLNKLGGSFKYLNELRESQVDKVQEALDMGEIESGCCKSAALSGLSRVQKLSNFSLFKATAAAVFWSSLELLLLLVAATDQLVLLGFQPNDINFPFNWIKGESTRRGKCKRRSPIGLKRESSCQEKRKKINNIRMIST